MQQSGQQFKAFQFVIDKTCDNRDANLEQNLAIRHTVNLEIKFLKVCHEMKFSKVAAARELAALQAIQNVLAARQFHKRSLVRPGSRGSKERGQQLDCQCTTSK